MPGLNETNASGTSADNQPSADPFDAAMVEASAEDRGPGDEPALPEPPASDDQGTDEPPAPGAEPAAQAPAADANTPPAGTPSDDIWAKASPELREARDRDLRDADLRLKSVQGRQSAADREAQRLRDRIAELERGGKQPSGQAEPKDGDGKSGNPATESNQKLREDYPEIAGPLLDELEALRKDVAKASEGVGRAEQERNAAFVQRQEATLVEKHPDWLDALGDNRFMGWLDGQPRAVKDAYQRNEQAIVDGAEAAWLVDQWKAAGIYAGKAPPSPPPPARDERRERQLQNGRDFKGGSGPGAANGVDDDDFDGALIAAAAEADRKMRPRA